jgi:predicted nucleic acid-binding Zn ribbon protein
MTWPTEYTRHLPFKFVAKEYHCKECGKRRNFVDKWLVTCYRCKNKNKRI